VTLDSDFINLDAKNGKKLQKVAGNVQIYLTLIPLQNDDPSERGRLSGQSLDAVRVRGYRIDVSLRPSRPCALEPPLPVTLLIEWAPSVRWPAPPAWIAVLKHRRFG